MARIKYNPRFLLDCTAGDVQYLSFEHPVITAQTCSLLTAGAEPEGEECRGQVPLNCAHAHTLLQQCVNLPCEPSNSPR